MGSLVADFIIDGSVIQTVDEVIQIVSEGIQGPPGPPGPQGIQGSQGIQGDFQIVSAIAFENVTGGNLINLWNDAGVLKARLAKSTEGYESDGFAVGATVAGAAVSVKLGGVISGLAGLIPGSRYFLSAIPGNVQAIPPTESGSVIKCVGKAISSTELLFNPEESIILA